MTEAQPTQTASPPIVGEQFRHCEEALCIAFSDAADEAISLNVREIATSVLLRKTLLAMTG